MPAPGVVRQSPPLELPTPSRERFDAYAEARAQRLPYLPGQVLVRFKDGVGRDGQQRALAAASTRSDVDSLEWIGELALLKDPGQPDPRILARELSQQTEVLYAEPNYLLRIGAVPNDPSYGPRQWNFQSINMPRAWDVAGGGSAEVIVAVIDSGVTSVPAGNYSARTWNGSSIVTFGLPVAPSPDFDLSRFVNPRDFTISTTAPPATVIDMNGHGTHVAGTIGENTNNGTALAGIAYNVRIMPLKVCYGPWEFQFWASAAGVPGFTSPDEGECPTDAIVAAIRFAADNGAKVINISLSGSGPITPLRDAITYAVQRGVFVAVSNGNAYESGNPAQYPASYAAALDGAVSVAATNRLNARSYYSSSGTYTEIAAPGGDAREGSLIWQASINQADASFNLIFPRFDRYQEWNIQGTSMASPHVAGVAALLASRGITNPATIESILRQTARDLGPSGRDNDFGAGLIQPFAALFGLGAAR
jgi:serine protease